MFATSADVLNMALAGGFLLLVVFLCVALFYLILVLRDVSKVTDETVNVVDRVKSAILEPLRLMDFAIEKIKPYFEAALEKRMKPKKK